MGGKISVSQIPTHKPVEYCNPTFEPPTNTDEVKIKMQKDGCNFICNGDVCAKIRQALFDLERYGCWLFILTFVAAAISCITLQKVKIHGRTLDEIDMTLNKIKRNVEQDEWQTNGPWTNGLLDDLEKIVVALAKVEIQNDGTNDNGSQAEMTEEIKQVQLNFVLI